LDPNIFKIALFSNFVIYILPSEQEAAFHSEKAEKIHEVKIKAYHSETGL
jgi:hypothetical protein